MKLLSNWLRSAFALLMTALWAICNIIGRIVFIISRVFRAIAHLLMCNFHSSLYELKRPWEVTVELNDIQKFYD